MGGALNRSMHTRKPNIACGACLRSVSRKIEAHKRNMGLDPEAPFPKGIRLAKSNRQRRAASKVAKCHRKIALQRKDWAHKLTTRIVDESVIVVLEDLKIRNMTASAKGTTQTPGKRVAQKSGLNRSSLDQAWYQIEQMLGYKTAWRGGDVLKVPAPYTRQRCSVRGFAHAGNRKGKHFGCQQCGHTGDADINAAKSMLAAGLAVSAKRDCARHADVEDAVQSDRPVKRQPALRASDG